MTTEAESLRTRGMRDLLPAQMARFRRIESVFLATMAAWGYREVRTPALEPLHLFTSAGALSPQLLEKVYSFLDWDGWSGERVVLRPDATIPVTRIYSEMAGGGIAKLCYVTDIFRFANGDEPRERWQCGAEVIGESWPNGDIEVIAAGYGLLRQLGFAGVRLQLSHAGLLRAILRQTGFAGDEQAARYDRLLDGDRTVVDELSASLPELGPALRLLTDDQGAHTVSIGNLRAAFQNASAETRESFDDLATLAEAVETLGCPVEIDLTMMRDFEYYTGAVFRFLLADGQSVGGGGRYDALIDGTPACGFALLIDELLERLPGEALAAEAALIAVSTTREDAAGRSLALATARTLQTQGFRAALVAGQPAAGWSVAVDANHSERRYEVRRPGHPPLVIATPEALADALAAARC